MLYDFTLTYGEDRGSIRPIRTYTASNHLGIKLMKEVIDLIVQACDHVAKENNVDIDETTGLEFREAWVDNTEDEALLMLLKDEPMIAGQGIIAGEDAREITKQLLNDFASTDDWESLFDGSKDSFASIDLNDFELTEAYANNENLKVPVGGKVYVRGQGNEEYNYLGRPTAKQLKEDPSRFFSLAYDQETGGLIGEVCAIDKDIIAVENFFYHGYTDTMETFPLPLLSWPNKYFSREKYTSKKRKEAMGKTEQESMEKLALMIAFDKL